MSERRAISTIAAITLGAVSCVLGLGLVARSAAALPPAPLPAPMMEPDAAASAPIPFTLGLLGLEPGALALIGLSGVVCVWPGRRRHGSPATAEAVDSAPESADRDQLLAPAA